MGGWSKRLQSARLCTTECMPRLCLIVLYLLKSLQSTTVLTYQSHHCTHLSCLFFRTDHRTAKVFHEWNGNRMECYNTILSHAAALAMP